MRRYIIEGLGDAAAYQKTRESRNSVYYDVQAAIAAKIESLDMPGRENCPLIFIGHSLGCHVISSFLWDLNKLTQRDNVDGEDAHIKTMWNELKEASPLRRLKTCAGIVTLGSNMPMFTFTFGPDSVFPLTSRVTDPKTKITVEPAFPGAALPGPLQQKARWLNFYSERDLLGFPLKALNEDYHNAEKIHDISVQSEAPWFIPYLWCLYAHTRYWTNRIVLRDTSQLIRDMIETSAEATAAAS